MRSVVLASALAFHVWGLGYASPRSPITLVGTREMSEEQHAKLLSDIGAGKLREGLKLVKLGEFRVVLDLKETGLAGLAAQTEILVAIRKKATPLRGSFTLSDLPKSAQDHILEGCKSTDPARGTAIAGRGADSLKVQFTSQPMAQLSSGSTTVWAPLYDRYPNSREFALGAVNPAFTTQELSGGDPAKAPPVTPSLRFTFEPLADAGREEQLMVATKVLVDETSRLKGARDKAAAELLKELASREPKLEGLDEYLNQSLSERDLEANARMMLWFNNRGVFPKREDVDGFLRSNRCTQVKHQLRLRLCFQHGPITDSSVPFVSYGIDLN